MYLKPYFFSACLNPSARISVSIGEEGPSQFLKHFMSLWCLATLLTSSSNRTVFVVHSKIEDFSSSEINNNGNTRLALCECLCIILHQEQQLLLVLLRAIFLVQLLFSFILELLLTYIFPFLLYTLCSLLSLSVQMTFLSLPKLQLLTSALSVECIRHQLPSEPKLQRN